MTSLVACPAWTEGERLAYAAAMASAVTLSLLMWAAAAAVLSRGAAVWGFALH
jgi:hypothetical protein